MNGSIKMSQPQTFDPDATMQVSQGAVDQLHLPVATTRPVEHKPHMGLELLLKIEAEARRVNTVKELVFFAANETLKLTRSRQIFIMSRNRGRNMGVAGISAVSTVDRKSAHVTWIESIVRALGADTGLAKTREFQLPAYTPEGDEEHKTYPFRAMLWLPFRLADGHVFGGMLLARDIPWAEADQIVADRLAETFAHAWAALEGPRKLRKSRSWGPMFAGSALFLLLLAGFYPVPMSVLAPLEVSAVNAKIIAAPLDGVVEAILVEPNAQVKTGDPLIRMSDTALRDEKNVAENEVIVAEAKLKLVMQSAINDPKMRREISIAEADVEVKKAHFDYAADMLNRTIVVAPADGIAVYSDRRDWLGHPVQVGERILDVADPSQLELRIFIPIHDSIAVQEGAKVRAFLDSDPVNPADANVKSASYEARPHENGVLAYQIIAGLSLKEAKGLRLGTRGTAQVSGRDVPLAFWLFRKPFTTIRQWLGL